MVGGKRFRGWKTARVTRSMEAIAGGFTLGVSERWASQLEAWPIAEGDECTVTLDGTTVITGYVDARNPSFASGDLALEVSGRDKSADLVDCSALLSQWEFVNADLLKLVQSVCAPHSVRVRLQPSLIFTKVKKLHIDPGETAFSVIENACRQAGVLAVSDAAGGIVLTRVGSARAAVDLEEGKNLLSASGSFNASARFAKYVCLGQRGSDDEEYGATTAQVRGEATDPNVKRASRVLVVRPEQGVTVASAKVRAQWEAITRAAKAATVTCQVQGWAQYEGGPLWSPNMLVHLRSKRLRVDTELLISQVDHSLTVDGGTTTTLTLKRRDAFLPEAKGVGGDNYWPEIVRGV